MTHDPALLRTLTERLAAWRGFRVGYAVGDAHGQYARHATHPTGRYLFACKRALHHGDASFMRDLPKRAADRDAALVCAVGEAPTLADCYAFDPATVLRHGRERRVRSKQGVRVRIYDVDADAFGVCLGDVVSGRAEPVGVGETRRVQGAAVGQRRLDGVGP